MIHLRRVGIMRNINLLTLTLEKIKGSSSSSYVVIIIILFDLWATHPVGCLFLTNLMPNR